MFVQGSSTQGAGVCGGYKPLRTEDAFGNQAPVSTAKTVNLTSSSGTLRFYGDGTCTTLITSTTLAAGASTTGFIFRDNTPGIPTITVASAGLTSATQAQTVQ